jgi:WD40-like Beta Propeller Repeat
MEDDGSHLRVVRSLEVGHLDHPTLTSDLEHVIYSEFTDPSRYVAATAPLWEEHLYLGDRKVIRSIDGRAVHHNTISPVDHALSYMISGPNSHVQVTEVEGEPKAIKANSARRLLLANGVSIPGGLILQSEELPRTTLRRIAIERYTHSGGVLSPVTATIAMHRRPAVSPSGKTVVWQSNERDPNVDDIHMADVDGSNHRLLTYSDAKDGHPWFSRDGHWVFFESNRTGNWEIYKLHIGSGETRQLTNDPAYVNTRPRC